MGHLVLGFRALLRVWTDAAFASQVGRWLGEHPTAGEPAAAPLPAPVRQAQPLPRHPRSPHTTPNIKLPAASAPPVRSEALSLLAVLQRDARFLDFIKEPLADFTDEEIGTTVRTIHKDAAAVIERIFGVEPLSDRAEGATLEVPAGYDPTRYRLLGNVPGVGRGPLRGTVVHPGWKAVRADVPAWDGRTDAANVLAPTEVGF